MLIAESPANNDDSAGKNYHDDDSGDDDESPADQLPTHLWAQLLVEPFSTGGAITENKGSNKFPAT